MAHDGSAALSLEIVTPDGLKLHQTGVDEVSAPSTAGRFGVLPGHVPVLASLQTGIVSWKAGGQEASCAVGPGFVEVSEGHVRILTDRYQAKDTTLDPVRIRADLKDIEEKIVQFEGTSEVPAFQQLVTDELWYAAQLELYGDPPPPTVHFVATYGTAPEGEASEAVEPNYPTPAA